MQLHQGQVLTASNFLLATAKSALNRWTENSRSSRVSDWCKQKQTCLQTKRTLFNSVWMLSNNFEVHNFHFFLPSKTKRSIIFASSQNKSKQTTSIFSTQRRFFPPFLLVASVIAASVSRQFHDSANFADLSAASLDSIHGSVLDILIYPGLLAIQVHNVNADN